MVAIHTSALGTSLGSMRQRAHLSRERTLSSVNIEAMMKPPPGPDSAFFRSHAASRHGLGRNTRLHWYVHWYASTRGKSLIPMHHRNSVKQQEWVALEHVRDTLRQRVWKITENNPVWNALIFLTICASATTDILETEPYADKTIFKILAMCYVIIFTFELLIRFWACPSRLRFWCNFLNWLDLLAILPWYIELILGEDIIPGAVDEDQGQSSDIADISTTVRILRLWRVIRVFKFYKYSASVRMFVVAVGQSLHSLLILLGISLIVVLIFSAVVYIVEEPAHNSSVPDLQHCRHPPCFNSILNTCWIVVNTVTTCGYGDVVPKTAAGMLLITLASIAGIVVLALPIAVFENNLARLHHAQNICHRLVNDISNRCTDPIDEEGIRRWIEIEIALDRMRPSLQRDGDAAGQPTHSLHTLEPGELLAAYDLDRKGYLLEEEALLMIADLGEMHSPDGTAEIHAKLIEVVDQVQALGRPLSVLEDRLLASRDLHRWQLVRLRNEFNKAFVATPREENRQWTSSFYRAVHSAVSRQGWSAPKKQADARAPRVIRLKSVVARPPQAQSFKLPTNGEDDADGAQGTVSGEKQDEIISATDRMMQLWDHDQNIAAG